MGDTLAHNGHASSPTAANSGTKKIIQRLRLSEVGRNRNSIAQLTHFLDIKSGDNLTRERFHELCQGHLTSLSKKELDAAFDVLDLDEDGCISKLDFVAAMIGVANKDFRRGMGWIVDKAKARSSRARRVAKSLFGKRERITTNTQHHGPSMYSVVTGNTGTDSLCPTPGAFGLELSHTATDSQCLTPGTDLSLSHKNSRGVQSLGVQSLMIPGSFSHRDSCERESKYAVGTDDDNGSAQEGCFGSEKKTLHAPSLRTSTPVLSATESCRISDSVVLGRSTLS